MKGLINSEHIIVHVTEQCVIYLLKAYSPINSTVSPQGFSLNQILHKLNKIKKHAQYTNVKHMNKLQMLVGFALAKKMANQVRRCWYH